MTVKVLYFAQLADLAGRDEETFELSDPSPEALYEQVAARHGFRHAFSLLQVAINHQLSAHGTVLQDGDEVAFLPPMAGG